MTKQNKTKLQFILSGILIVTFAVAGCNNGADKTVVKDSITEMKMVPPVTVKDTMDTMTGHKAPVVETPPK